MRLNINDSAKYAKVARSTIYAKIASGKLSKSSDGKIDVSELLRVFGNPSDRDRLHNRTLLDNIEKAHPISPEIELLKDKVRFLENSLSEARNREEWLKGQVEKLTDVIKLLEPPKARPPEENQEPKQEKQGFFSRFLS